MGPGDILGNRYALESLLGRGGMGRVLRGRDLQTDRLVAVKLLHHDQDDEQLGASNRFKREIAILAHIHHPGVPAILDWGEHEGQLYFVSELVEGVSLRVESERRGAWSPADATSLIADVALALGAAHTLGIIHRDVNPNNIMIANDGGVRLLDFGIARVGGTDLTRLTSTGTVIGTPAYMSPEQFDARWVDERSDVYSAGVVLFEMLTGQLPFSAPTAVALALQHKTATPPTVRSLRPDVPVWLERIVSRCLEKDPVRRFASGSTLARELADPGRQTPLRRRRLASGDFVMEDFSEQSEWALVLASAMARPDWSAGMGLRFEERYYRLQQIETPTERTGRWTFRFTAWPEHDVLRGVVDYEQDIAARAQADTGLLRSLFRRWT